MTAGVTLHCNVKLNCLCPGYSTRDWKNKGLRAEGSLPAMGLAAVSAFCLLDNRHESDSIMEP